MSSLKAFLNPIQVENKEVIVSNRFQEDGKPVPFIIKPISEKENESLPARGAWIEILPVLRLCAWLIVAPCTGSVD